MGSWRRTLQSLHITFILSVALPLVLICGFVTYAGLGMLQQQYESGLQEEVELVARATRFPLSRLVEAGQPDEVKAVLGSIFEIGRIYGASVYDVDGVRIARLGVADRDVTDSRRAADVVASGDDIGGYRVVSGESVFSYFTPLIASDGRINGLLQITRDRNEVEEHVALLARNAWWLWTVLSLLILIVAVVGHYRAVGRHVKGLLGTMERASEGELSIRAAGRGPRELRWLAEGLNHMLGNIDMANREIRNRQQRELTLERRLRHQEKTAMIGRVAGGVAHELGAPLSVVKGRSQRLRRCSEREYERRQLDEIDSQVERMTAIIRDLLDCFRHVPERREEVDLGALLGKVRDRHGADGDMHLELVLPHTVEQRTLQGDALRLELAVDNLVRNAVTFADGRVRIALESRGDSLTLVVEDDGPGVPPEIGEAVFEPFFTTRPAGKGTGLGLAVVKSVVLEHDGQWAVETSELGGSRFVLQLPLRGEVTA